MTLTKAYSMRERKTKKVQEDMNMSIAWVKLLHYILNKYNLLRILSLQEDMNMSIAWLKKLPKSDKRILKWSIEYPYRYKSNQRPLRVYVLASVHCICNGQGYPYPIAECRKKHLNILILGFLNHWDMEGRNSFSELGRSLVRLVSL